MLGRLALTIVLLIGGAWLALIAAGWLAYFVALAIKELWRDALTSQ